MEKYYNDSGEVGVLYSPGYGAGWSTWGSSNCEFLLFDKTLVKMALNGAEEDELENYLQSTGNDVYIGGWRDIQVEFMKPGTAFLVNEYDGSESIEYYNNVIPYIA